ncbi:PIG-L family deacetylase [Flagellimonas sp. DF-77]|uniref:PIG-L family deacetylase n=1 Tax=Flagellimonas algarum TaxID=3230298 RepID=UPI0033998C4C
MRISWALLLLFVSSYSSLIAQRPKQRNATEIHHELQKLNFLGTALYVAAHPDDENTRLISYLSNEVKAQTVYLSLTRGDGGQNLIGAELREYLGVLRTQELLAARGVDGGEQRFSRANDFGFSKHPKETLEIWDEKEVLGDVIWSIRQLKPDIIINRFDHRTPGRTHGHHTASAMLSHEAFDLANDPKSYPEQLSATSPWQPRRLFFNTSWWFYGSRENFEKADKSQMLQMDIGVYYPSLGLSNNEIAAKASSQHLCQGFGRLTTRGSQSEYIELLKGDLPNDKSDLFDGINTTWSRMEGGKAIGAILDKVERDFNFADPSTHVPDLVKAYELLQQSEDAHWKALKSPQLQEIILACAGMYLEASAENASVVPGETAKINFEVLNRSRSPFELKDITIAGTDAKITPAKKLGENIKENLDLELQVATTQPYSNPYWLNRKGTLGMYDVRDRNLIGKPETPAAYQAVFTLDLNGTTVRFQKPVVYRYSKPDKGELYEPFVVLPQVTAAMEDDVVIFADDQPKQVAVKVRAGKNDVSGVARLDLPSGWKVNPASVEVDIAQKGETQNVYFTVTPPPSENEGFVRAVVESAGMTYGKQLIEIDYDHIPKQSVLSDAKAKVVRLNIQKSGEHIGYIVGAGDKVPESLTQIGYQVHLINVDEIEAGSLAKYDGIVVGIRAYNVVEALKFKQNHLLDYVEQGGNLIVQYNTANRWRGQFENIAPYPLTISRDRVTDEHAEVSILAKDHALVNFPNAISSSDFDGWVQERGLYFPNEWGDEFTPILTMADEGESQKQGSLLVAPYGKGNYIYTGLSFFRELPAGVSGAYKLFANMLSLGKEISKEDQIKG